MQALDSQYYSMSSSLLWVMFHGYSDRNRFKQDSRMHEHVSTLYLQAPYWWRGWSKGDMKSVVDILKEYDMPLVLACHSKANQPGHRYAQACLDAGIDVACIVHYAGFWKGFKADCPCVPVCNTQDKRGMKRGTEACAEAYGTSVLWVDGGDFTHRWNHENNDMIINRVGSAVLWNSLGTSADLPDASWD